MSHNINYRFKWKINFYLSDKGYIVERQKAFSEELEYVLLVEICDIICYCIKYNDPFVNRYAINSNII